MLSNETVSFIKHRLGNRCTDEFIEYLNQALDKDNIFDFSEYGEDNIIELDNYIIEFLKKDKIKN